MQFSLSKIEPNCLKCFVNVWLTSTFIGFCCQVRSQRCKTLKSTYFKKIKKFLGSLIYEKDDGTVSTGLI